MSYQKRLSMLIFLDSAIVLFSIYIGYFILMPYYSSLPIGTLFLSSAVLLISHHIFAFLYRLYQRAWEYASVNELLAIVVAVSYSIVATGIVQAIFMGTVYTRVLVITWMLHMILIGGSRFSWRVIRDSYRPKQEDKERALIVGAGAAGTMLVRQMLRSNESDMKVVAFVDDDRNKQRLDVLGVPVKGRIEDIPALVNELEIDRVIIAIPSMGKQQVQKVYEQCSKTTAKTQIMPMIEDIVSGKVSINNFREVQVEDLLGRDPIELDIKSIEKNVSGQTVLVTGAGGSIGSEICRQVCRFTPTRLVLVGHGENSIYLIDQELQRAYGDQIEIVPVIADVQDHDRMMDVMSTFRPNVVYHAAAHKHVPLMEFNPREAVKNNVFGTRNVAEAADAFGVDTFVLVSTDKAVNPTNVMGSTKRIAEMVIQSLDKKSKTKFVAVRFGNVLGSRGSVVPLFKKQIQAGGPVTVTHPEMTRYFMTIPEASRLVLQAGALARGGEVFVLDMGEPVKIVDLARNLIRLSGYTEEEIDIEFLGIRPGEKMFEELLGEKEVHPEPVFPKIFIGKAVLEQEHEVHYLLARFEEFEVEELRRFVLNVANRRENLVVGG
ncbi:polysaccharide biosynthesis protein [Mangrovibacillus cuniculi]|uniref:Polysaccharide biosynthesis protein n=1 Tax=Mangrovibacillus cuniculi TaxID=2593652 RepID=A0A7S8HG62_9BACI|nr:nucleoside-diphosphate sugar epimerase/dehydratase [Mangrovibacillus cuniculi]QPC47659.1 polysaccharide biosynthesis protein [Mangrovibacillus cuniculi]